MNRQLPVVVAAFFLPVSLCVGAIDIRSADGGGEASYSVVSADPEGDCLDHQPLDEGKGVPLCGHAAAGARLFAAEQEGLASLREADADTDVTHYFLDIEIIPEYSGPSVVAVKIEGVNTITAESTTTSLSLFTVDLRSNLTVNAVTGNTTGWSRVGDTIVITLDDAYDAGESFQVAIDYEGYPSTSAFGAFKWWERNGNLVVATLSEPYYARYWWPCKDALDDKSTMQTHVTVPDWMVAASNGQDEGTQGLLGSRTKYMWRVTYPMIPYLASLAITNYERYDGVYNYNDGSPQTMPVTSYVYPDHWDFGNNQPYSTYKAGLDELPSMIATMASKFGEYPFVAEKYGVAETGGTGGLSANMEHQTLSSMWQVANYSDIMAHELGHQWWGDDVTCQTWYDIWLNEGFASYSESIYREYKPGGGTNAFWTRVNDRRPSNPDAQVYRTSIGSVGAIFSGNDVYSKGSWVVHMLRHVMGSDAFFSAVADYRANFEGDSATTAEFAASFSASFGHDLSWFTDQWVMNPGSPDYEWNYDTVSLNGDNYLRLAIWQKQNSEGFGLFTMPIDIRITTNKGPTVHTVWNDGWTEYYLLPLGGSPTSVEFDEDGGVSNRNWVLFDSRTLVGTTIAAPPVLADADVTAFASTNGATTIDLLFSEDIGSFDAADVTLTGDSSGSHAPLAVNYTPATQLAVVEFVDLPDDTYTFVVLDDSVSANGKTLDGEVDDSNWWDDTLLPSGDGQPGGDAVITFGKLAGDADSDGDIDLDDFATFPACMTGPNDSPYMTGCGAFDFDADHDVDADDFAAFQRAYTGSM